LFRLKHVFELLGILEADLSVKIVTRAFKGRIRSSRLKKIGMASKERIIFFRPF